jgi:hypothetical protein
LTTSSDNRILPLTTKNKTLNMRILLYFALVVFAVCSIQPQIQAQDLSKDEIKKWKNKAKEYKRNPAALKAVVEESERYRRESQDLLSQVNQLEAAKANQQARVNQLEAEVGRLQNDLAITEESLRNLANEQPDYSGGQADNSMAGLIFRVQIGAYSKTNIPASLDGEGDNMDLEMEDGLQKIIIGKFQDFESAKSLRDYMRKAGIPDAWVVPYMDGTRITLDEAGITPDMR